MDRYVRGADGVDHSAMGYDGASSLASSTSQLRSSDAGASSALGQTRSSATLYLGDLEHWMDETYIQRCIGAMRWDRMPPASNNYQPVTVKMIRSASAVAGYCFLNFASATHAQAVLEHFESTQQRTLMPNSQRTFKLNWATGLPGVSPSYQSEHSVFVGDLARDVTEAELVSLFTPLFPSTRAAKIMCDPRTGASKGFGFVRFGLESDMERALALGQSGVSSGLSLRGRVIRISAATGSSGTGGQRRRAGEGLDRPSVPTLRTVPTGIPYQEPQSPTGSSSRTTAAAGAAFLLSGLSPRTPPASASRPAFLGSPPRAESPTRLQRADEADSDFNDSAIVFVGGLPSFVAEDTLRAMFNGFGDIVYVKIPPNKGCGFIQFVNRIDAESAIARMDGWPIHGKSRLRVTWGRSTTDRQVEHVRRLATILNVPFETVWDMAQGQSPAMLKSLAHSFYNAGISVGDARGAAEAIGLAHLARAGALDATGAVRSDWGSSPSSSPTASAFASPRGTGPLPIPAPASPGDSRFSSVVWGDQGTNAAGNSPYARVPASDFAPFARPVSQASAVALGNGNGAIVGMGPPSGPPSSMPQWGSVPGTGLAHQLGGLTLSPTSPTLSRTNQPQPPPMELPEAARTDKRSSLAETPSSRTQPTNRNSLPANHAQWQSS